MTVPSATSVSATNSGGGATTVTLTAGSYTTTSLLTHLVAKLTADRAPSSGAWTASVSTGQSGTGLVTINCTGTWSLSWTSTVLRDLLGHTGNYASVSAAQTGTINARGLWLPDCPMTIDGDPSRAPKVTDARASESPTGLVITLSGTSKRVHRGLKWSHVARAKTWEGAATTTYASLQQWLDDTQNGDGHTWFTPGSAFQAYWDNAGTDTLVGADLNAGAGPTAGWFLSPAIDDISNHVRRTSADWLQMWSVEFPRIVSEG